MLLENFDRQRSIFSKKNDLQDFIPLIELYLNEKTVILPACGGGLSLFYRLDV